MGDDESALASYDECIAINPGVGVVHTNRGVALAALHRFQEAIDAFDTALALNPDDVSALNNKGICLSRIGRDGEAMEAMDRARKLSRLPHIQRGVL